MWGNIAIAFLLAFIVSFVTTPYSIKLAKKVGAVDIPKDERRMHGKTMPKLGGIAVIAGFLISSIYLICIMTIENSLELFGPEQYFKKLLGLFLGIIIITIVGIVDDIKILKPYQKLLGQLLAACVVVGFGIQIEHVNIPMFAKIGLTKEVSAILTVIWIVGITNAINLMDGLDGLSSGITLISCISLLIIFALNYSPIIAILIVTSLIGALVGFLPFNFAPAKTFIGDTGSNFLGFILSVVSIMGVAKTYTAMVIVLPMLVLGLPILDVLWAIARRIIKGKSIKAIFKADNGHVHHKLVQKGFTQKQAVLILYGISAACGIFAIILFENGIWKALSFVLMVIASLAIGYRNFVNQRNEIEDAAKYECTFCKYIYNPKYGNEKAGVKPGTSFKNLPKNWVCPVCGEKKDVFELHED
ncbi:MAG: undecaprenyl/decaprenyl-phosphate alpha-N-acetylglucosaminyl 1-phosphate transferase [Clostridia bacterium]|nr:undecaprenyl/decaprenyl-phosphate alpha-N-acetylglucosaminyl 1-phosphate transferase [Clostridia bacterium]